MDWMDNYTTAYQYHNLSNNATQKLSNGLMESRSVSNGPRTNIPQLHVKLALNGTNIFVLSVGHEPGKDRL